MKTRLNLDSWIFTKPIAHRGLHDLSAPENSIAAYLNAAEKGYPIELDVQMTADDELVCFHDDNLERVTGLDADIRETKYSELKKLRINNSDSKIPLFKEMLEAVDGKTPLLIEVKAQKRKGIEEKMLSFLKNYKGEFAIQSFDPTVLYHFKKLAPEIIRGQLGNGMRLKLGFIKNFTVKYLPLNFRTHPDFINYDFQSLPIGKFRSNSLPVICWTVRNTEDLIEASKKAKNYIFENFLPNK